LAARRTITRLAREEEEEEEKEEEDAQSCHEMNEQEDSFGEQSVIKGHLCSKRPRISRSAS